MPVPGAVMPFLTAAWLTVDEDQQPGAERADDLRGDVADGVDRGRALVEDHRDRHGRVEMPARDVAEREDRREQAEAEGERDDQQVRRRRAGGRERRHRRVADRQEQERADEFGEIRAAVHGLLLHSTIPRSLTRYRAATIESMPDRDANPEPLSRNRDFKVLLSTQGISSLGDAVSFTALPLLVLALTGSGLAMGVVGALQTLPDLVFGMVAGALADRNDRKRMMFLADLGRAVLTALIPLSVYLGGPTMAVILVVAAPMSVLRSFFLAGYTASVPGLVGRPLMARANSYFEAVYSLGLHRRPGDRRPARHDDRPGCHARDRRGVVRPVGPRAAVRASRAARPGRPAATATR